MQKIDLNADPLGLGKLINKLGVNVFTRAVEGLEMAGDDLAGQGRLLAPVKRGDLRRSIHKDAGYAISEANGGRVSINVRAATPYAKVQHQHEEFVHPLGGEAGYLTKPADQRRGAYLKMIESKILQGIKETAAGG